MQSHREYGQFIGHASILFMKHAHAMQTRPEVKTKLEFIYWVGLIQEIVPHWAIRRFLPFRKFLDLLPSKVPPEIQCLAKFGILAISSQTVPITSTELEAHMCTVHPRVSQINIDQPDCSL